MTSLIVRDEKGNLFLRPFCNNTFCDEDTKTKVGNDWHFTHYFVGNWTGNGTDDLIVRTEDGDLLLYPFRDGTFYNKGARTKVGNGWHFTHYFVGNWI